jgi:HK97 gp10 family phage protein
VAKVDVKDFSKDVKSAYEQARERSLEIIGLTAEKYAKEITPVDTGRLRNSITHKVDGKEVYIGTNVEYAPHVEYGTIKQQAQPFLRPAATEHPNTYKQIVQDEFAKIK